MKTLAKYHVCNHCVIGEKTFKNILIGPGKLPGLSRNGPQDCNHAQATTSLKEMRRSTPTRVFHGSGPGGNSHREPSYPPKNTLKTLTSLPIIHSFNFHVLLS